MNKEIEKSIIGIVNENIEGMPIKAHNLLDGLSEMGLNSVSFIKMIIELETIFDIEFDDEYLDFSKFSNIKDIIQLIEEKLQKKE